MTTMTEETLALIADSELPVTKELIPFTSTLTVDRARDENGNIIKNKFACSTEKDGFTHTSTAGNRFVAERNLRKHFESLGFAIMWTAVRDLTAPTDESEAPVVEPVFVAPREVQDTNNMLEPGTLQTPAEEIEVGEHEGQEHGLTMYIPTLDKSGWLTPLSDPLAYRRIYLAAWLMATGVSAYAVDRTLVANRDVQTAVAAVMMSGDAGASVGIPAKAVNPWALGTNGQQEMLWVRVGHKTPDPTTAPFRAGMGPAREAHLKTLSGLPAFPEKAQQWLDRREAKNFIGTKGTSKTVPQKNELAMKRSQAHAAGTAARTIAINKGESEADAEVTYKWVYCATLRFLGEINPELEKQLERDGVSEDMIIEYSKGMKRAV